MIVHINQWRSEIKHVAWKGSFIKVMGKASIYILLTVTECIVKVRDNKI